MAGLRALLNTASSNRHSGEGEAAFYALLEKIVDQLEPPAKPEPEPQPQSDTTSQPESSDRSPGNGKHKRR